jgi:dihydrofolate reductase
MNFVISKELPLKKLLFSSKEDMKFFKEMTINNVVIMGRKTFESIGGKPLLNRFNIVITTQQFSELSSTNNEVYCNSVEEAITLSKKLHPEKEIFIIGGGQIYNYCLENNLVDKIYCNKFFEEKESDTFFPKLNKDIWNKTVDKISNDKQFEYKEFVKF